MKSTEDSKSDQIDDHLLQQALPLESNFDMGEDYYVDEGDREAVDYLLRVRN